MTFDYTQYFFVILIGLCVGFAELIQRFQSEKIFDIAKGGVAYILINGVASALALFLIDIYDLGGLKENSNGVTIVLIAGLSSIALLRSSIFTYKVGDKDVGIGFGQIINIFLDRADRAFDKNQALKNAPNIAEIMKDVEFSKAKVNLTYRCLAMLNLSESEQRQLNIEVSAISDDNADNQTKSFALGGLLASKTGNELLKKIVELAGDSLILTSSDQQIDPRIDDMINKFSNEGIDKGDGQ